MVLKKKKTMMNNSKEIWNFFSKVRKQEEKKTEFRTFYTKRKSKIIFYSLNTRFNLKKLQNINILNPNNLLFYSITNKKLKLKKTKKKKKLKYKYLKYTRKKVNVKKKIFFRFIFYKPINLLKSRTKKMRKVIKKLVKKKRTKYKPEIIFNWTVSRMELSKIQKAMKKRNKFLRMHPQHLSNRVLRRIRFLQFVNRNYKFSKVILKYLCKKILKKTLKSVKNILKKKNLKLIRKKKKKSINNKIYKGTLKIYNKCIVLKKKYIKGLKRIKKNIRKKLKKKREGRVVKKKKVQVVGKKKYKKKKSKYKYKYIFTRRGKRIKKKIIPIKKRKIKKKLYTIVLLLQ